MSMETTSLQNFNSNRMIELYTDIYTLLYDDYDDFELYEARYGLAKTRTQIIT